MNNRTASHPQNFEEWARLAIADRDAFETQRRRVIEQAIARAPARQRHRLRCLQWKLDQIRATSRTPMAACLRMNRLLWEMVAGESGLLACLYRAAPDTPPDGLPSAQIIPLTRRH